MKVYILIINFEKLLKKIEGPLVIANYVTDINDVIAVKGSDGKFQVPKEVKNDDDWRLYQELLAQADVFITGAGYLTRYAAKGKEAQNIIDQFDQGAEYEDLGNWRIKNGYQDRNPDMAVVSRSLNFDIPQGAFDTRQITIFTTDEMASDKKAQELENAGAKVIGTGKKGVNGQQMIDELGQMGYQVIKMSTGPRVLKILLESNVLDRLYITRVQRDIAGDSTNDVITVLGGKDKIDNLDGFTVVERYLQKKVTTKDGETNLKQEFIVYDSHRLVGRLKSK